LLHRDLPIFGNLRDFVFHLESAGQLTRIRQAVSVVHEITEIHRRVLRQGGGALLFERPVTADGTVSNIPLLTNLFGSVERVAWGLGVYHDGLADLGEALAELREPSPPRNLTDAWNKLPLARALLSMQPRTRTSSPVQYRIHTGPDIDLRAFPIQTHWPGEPAPLITWPLVFTQPPEQSDLDECNVGVYRIQVIGRDRAIIRWLQHRGGAKHHHQWRQLQRDMPVAIVIGADPATILSAVLPLPEGISELKFSGLLRGARPEVVRCVTVPLSVPSQTEIVIEGIVSATETMPEGPYGDHTGYYNIVEQFPVLQVTAITTCKEPIYLSTFTGRAPDEPSRIGEALNELFLPLLRRQFPEIIDLWLPPEACSYRIAVVSISKRYPGQARRVMLDLWSTLPQFTYTKLLIVVDEDIDVRNWADVMWAVATRSDSSRDLLSIDDTPIDYLDFASPRPGLGGKLGIDATNKIAPETDRSWGKVLAMDPMVVARIDEIWGQLGIMPIGSGLRSNQ
jgi:4-hydroxy-3-polyprenylbenzoate decarboxylase